MSIKLKLILSYIAMLILPIIIFFFSADLVTGGFLKKNFPKENNTVSVQVGVGPVSLKNFAKLMEQAKFQPKLLEDVHYLRRLEKEFPYSNWTKSGLVVRKGDRIVYASPRLDYPALYRKLPRFGYLDPSAELTVNQHPYNIDQFYYYYPDGSPGSLFVIADVNPAMKVYKHLLLTLAIFFLALIVLVNGLLTFLVSRSVTKPIYALKRASEQIKEGNLGFQVKPSSRDEIGDLARAFEAMRERLQRSIEQQMRYETNRKELLSSISHDLKTPITCIKGYVEGMMDGVADTPEKMNHYMRTIRNKAVDLDQMIEELFLFSKLDLMKQPFNFEPLDLRAYLEDFIGEMRFDFEEKGIALSFNSTFATPALVIADRVQLGRVIGNIVENSAKYMDPSRESPQVRVILTREETTVTMKIEDNGKGIRPEDLPLIFDRFYRADPARNSSTGGSGLGLAIAKLIVEGHSGRIWAESVHGEGTSIYIRLRLMGKEELGA